MPVPPWYAEPGLVALVAARVTDTLASVSAGRRSLPLPGHLHGPLVPEQARDTGDTYPAQLAESAGLVAAEARIGRWEVAWQSAGRTPEPWLGPDVRDVVRRLAETGGVNDVHGVVICPIGFVADHLEVLYDLDIELAAVAAQVGLSYARTASLNDDPRFIGVLADVVSAAAARRGLSRACAGWWWSAAASAGWPRPGSCPAGRTVQGGASTSLVLESSSRLGGALDSQEFGGRPVDTGPDGFLGRRPEATDLCRQIGLGDALVPVAGGGAGVWAARAGPPAAPGLALGIPTRFWPAARSGVLGLRGQLGLARDVLLPRPDVRGPIGDRSIGPLVARKLGQRVVDRLVDPLIGGIHAGSVDDMSAAAVYPPLLTAARKRGSLMRALRAELPRAAPDDPEPLFWALEGGMATMVERLRTVLVARGVEIRCGTAGRGARTAWRRVDGADGRRAPRGRRPGARRPRARRPAGCSAPTTTRRPACSSSISYAPVTLVTLRVRSDAAASPLTGTGFLVPRRSPGPAPYGGDAWAVTACTYLSQKWPHLAAEGDLLLRASLGRFGDDRAGSWSDAEVVDRVVNELGELIGLSGEPLETLVTRWPQAFPQYRVHHLMRTAGIEAAAARLGGLAVAGAAYRGVGIPACIASGRAAAQAVG